MFTSGLVTVNVRLKNIVQVSNLVFWSEPGIRPTVLMFSVGHISDRLNLASLVLTKAQVADGVSYNSIKLIALTAT